MFWVSLPSLAGKKVIFMEVNNDSQLTIINPATTKIYAAVLESSSIAKGILLGSFVTETYRWDFVFLMHNIYMWYVCILQYHKNLKWNCSTPI
jgi:hypothetical protein